MDIEDSVFPVPNKVGGENLHEAGEYDEIHLGFLEMRLKGGFGFLAVAIVDRGKRKSEAAREGAKLGMISSKENRLGGKTARFPCKEDRFGGVSFFGDKNGKPTAGSRTVGQAKGELHSQVTRQRFKLSADSTLVEFRARPRGEEGHAKLSAGDLLFQGFDIGAHAEELLSHSSDRTRAVWTH